MLKPVKAVVFGCTLLAGFENLYADLYHYRNVIVGDRAVGLAGAYCAISDDASGVAYNPAGLAFALSNDISGSTNAFYKKKITYKKTIGDADFTENSEGQFAPFFGGLQKLDHLANGLSSAFGIYSRDTELKDQNDEISSSELEIDRFHRTANVRASTNFYGVALAYRLSPALSLGFGVNYAMVDELNQVYQETTFKNGKFLTQNIRERLQVGVLESVFGIQAALGGSFSLGLSVKKGTFLSQKYQQSTDTTQYDGKNIARTNSEIDSDIVDDPLGDWPLEVRTGFAWFASTSFLWSFDVIYDGPAEGDLALYKRNAVVDYASGFEFYMSPSLPLRFGFFTNNDVRDDVSAPTAVGGQEQVNYVGGTLVLGWVQPNSQVSLGYVRQQGTGKAQKTRLETLQDIEATIDTIALSATHNF